MELISLIGIDVVREASVLDVAAVDAETRRYAPTCCPGTREQHISDLTDWATGVNGDQSHAKSRHHPPVPYRHHCISMGHIEWLY
jgi:hypothetical protein